MNRKLDRKKLLPLLMFVAGLLFLLIFEITRSDAEFSRENFRTASNYSADAAVKVGADRPADLFLPSSYSKEIAVPLLIDLHGYTGSGQSQAAYSFLQSAANTRGVAYLAPDGLKDSSGNRFWNASSACCNFGGSKVSDVDYISELIKEVSSKVTIDQSRIYLFGHSNGHFMSYKFVCSTDSVIAAVAGLAGAMDNDPNACNKLSMNVLHIHGTNDATIAYQGGAIFGNKYPSADQTVAQWEKINSCNKSAETEIDLLQSVQGSETSAITFTCAKKSLVLWRINGGVHVPALDEKFALRTLDWLLAHRK